MFDAYLNKDEINAVERVRKLESENADQAQEIERLREERDAAVEDMKAFPRCEICEHCDKPVSASECYACRAITGGITCNFEWRGVKPQGEETNA